MKNSTKRILFGAACYYLMFSSYTLAGYSIKWWQYLMMIGAGVGLTLNELFFPRNDKS